MAYHNPIRHKINKKNIRRIMSGTKVKKMRVGIIYELLDKTFKSKGFRNEKWKGGL